ncbi:hypothetical protein GCM10009730_45130 [Streptomyces albidochromogenes]
MMSPCAPTVERLPARRGPSRGGDGFRFVTKRALWALASREWDWFGAEPPPGAGRSGVRPRPA